MDVRFTADRNLGTLAKWLRILGFDTVYERGIADTDFIRKAAGEGRVVLTRKRGCLRLSPGGRIVVVKTDRARLQLGEVLQALSLEPDPAKRMTRCLVCNTALEPMAKARAEGRVPVYVYEKCNRFKSCPTCGRLYWPGTHLRHIEASLRVLIPSRRPRF